MHLNVLKISPDCGYLNFICVIVTFLLIELIFLQSREYMFNSF